MTFRDQRRQDPVGSGARGAEESGPLEEIRQTAPGTVSVVAIGCKANREEMECLLSRLTEAGWRVVPPGVSADLTIVNTCTVTAEGDADSRQAIRRAGRGGSARIVVTGCLAQRDPGSLAALPAVASVVGNAEKPRLAEWILGDALARSIRVAADPTVAGFAPYGTGRAGRRTRATLKVQDGCDARCTYCIIPRVRGGSRSRSMDDCREQARRLAASGYREIALTGINTAAWGRDLPGRPDVADLVEALAGVAGVERLRLNSLEPDLLTPEMIGRLTACPRLCPHYHLPLQSGDAATLRRMGRPYDPAGYLAVVASIRARSPRAAIGCDLLSGFPGEDDAAFDATLRLVEEAAPAYLHAFSYSERPGVPSARLGPPPARAETRVRTARLRALGAALRRRFQEGQIGSEQDLLPERMVGPGRWLGTTGNYLKVRFRWESRPGERPELLRVRVDGRGEDGVMEGTVLGPAPRRESAGPAGPASAEGGV